MRFQDVTDYFCLKKIILNPWGFIRLKGSQKTQALFEIRFKDGYSVYLRPGTLDRHIFHRMFVRDEYRIGELAPGNLDCVIDIGGHIGLFSIRVAQLARKILVFEPILENFELLEKNLSSERFSHVACFRAAVTDRKKDVKIYKSQSTASHSAYRSARGGYELVSGLSLKDIFQENNIIFCDLLKLDCEGSEYDIIYNTDDEVISRIGRIYMEYHHIDHTNPLWDMPHLKKHLETRGFRVEIKASKAPLKKSIMYCYRGTGTIHQDLPSNP